MSRPRLETRNTGRPKMASFSTDFFTKAGCVEWAIVSARSPKFEFDGQSIDWFVSKQAAAGQTNAIWGTARFEPSLTREQERETTHA